MLRWIRYALALRRYPEARDFIDMGLGIEARYRRAKKSWDPHLSRAQEFSARALTPGARVAILGSGRLLDVPLARLQQAKAQVTCFDADPLARRAAQKAGFQFECLDLSASIDAWTRSVVSHANSGKALLSTFAAIIKGLRVNPSTLPGNFEVILSQNLLGQIPLFFRDRVAAIVEQQGIKADENGNLPEPLQGALRNASEALQRGHLKLLVDSKCAKVSIISDMRVRYLDAQGKEFYVDEALLLKPDAAMPGYSLKAHNSWSWEVAPLGEVSPEYSAVHEIGAWCFEREGR
jgi:hypothetical protein